MKAQVIFLIIYLSTFMSSAGAKVQSGSTEKSLQKSISVLSEIATSTPAFERNYASLYKKAVKIQAKRETFSMLEYQKLMFYYHSLVPDTVSRYATILTDYYRKTNDIYNYYFVQAAWADVNTSKGRVGEALNIGNRMIKEAAQNQEKIGMAYGAYSLAIAYFSMNYHKKAITYFEQAIPIFYQEKRWSIYGISTCNYLGSLTSLKRYGKAEKILFRLDSLISVSENSEKPFLPGFLIANVWGIVAPQLYCYLNQPQMVRRYLKHTVAIYHKYPHLSKLPLLQARLLYGKVTKNYAMEIAYADSLLNFYGDDVSNGYRMYSFKSEAYEGLDNYREALEQLKRYNELKDSVYGDEALNQVSQFSAMYGVDRLKLEKAELALQMKEKQANSFLITVCILIVLFFTIVLFTFYLLRAIRRQKKMITIKDDFIRNVSHEIRTPLNYIVGFSNVIAQSADDSMKSMTDKIHQGSDELLKMFDDIILLSDNESGGRVPTYEDVDVKEICDECVKRIEGQLDSNIMLVRKYPEGPVLFRTDKLKLRYVLFNLLHNAAKFTEKGTICVLIDHTDRQCSIRVSDTGKGINPESYALLFNSFFKEDKFTQGLGLGLTNARHALEMMGGTLSLNTEYTGGTEFVVVLHEPNKN